MLNRNRILALAAAAVLGGTALVTAQAADRSPAPGPMLADLDEKLAIKRMKDRGELLSIEAMIERVKREYGGRIIEIELERDDGRYDYEIKLVDDAERAWKLEFDAASGELRKQKRDD